MKQIKEFFKNKKVLVGTVAVILLATVGTVFALNQPQTKNEVAQQETISDEEHAKLLANIKKLQSEDQKKTATVAPAEVKEQEEKPTVEQSKKEVKVEQKPVPKVEQSKPVVKPEVPKSLPKPPVASAKTKPTPAPEKPTPAPEKPTPTKYCNYTGNRKMVHNICNYGTPWGKTSYERIRNKWVNRVNNGEIEMIVFKQEPERYHLITTDYLREGLKNAKDNTASCYINGSCIGFSVEE